MHTTALRTLALAALLLVSGMVMAQQKAAAPKQKTQLIYVYDALCGWCYGFSPVMQRLAREHGDKFEVEVVSGGLRLGKDAGLIMDVAPFIKEAYKDVEQAAGVRFGTAFLKGSLAKNTLMINSLPPAVAMAIVREQAPAKALAFSAQLHKAIYQDGISNTKPDDYLPYVKAVGVSTQDFVQKMKDPKYIKLAEADFKRAKQLGATGFPKLMRLRNGKYDVIAEGYVGYDFVLGALGW